MRVRAKTLGHYDTLRHPGEIFFIKGKEDMGSWMEVVGDEETSVNEIKENGKMSLEQIAQETAQAYGPGIYRAKQDSDLLQANSSEEVQETPKRRKRGRPRSSN
jgi:hypothetical protein